MVELLMRKAGCLVTRAEIELASPTIGTGLVVTVTLPFTGAPAQARSAA